MDDRHGHRAQQRDRPERRRRFDPVRELERDRLSRPHASRAEAARDAPRELVAVAERPAPGSHARENGEVERSALGEPGREDRAERLVRPRAVRDVPASPLVAHATKLQVQRHAVSRPTVAEPTARSAALGRLLPPAFRNIVLRVQNVIPIERAVAERSLQGRADAYAEEVRRLIDAAYAVMRDTGAIDPRVSDIVAAAGLSNQAFYRHFRGKDELLLAVLDDGQRRLVGYLEHRLEGVEAGGAQIREWIAGVMEQARNRDAAENTRPFAIGSTRLADRFPEEIRHSRELVVAPLRAAVEAAGGDPQRDADAIYELAMGTMNEALVQRVTPSDDDVAHLVDFALKAIG